MRLKKRILRTLIREIIVDTDSTAGEIALRFTGRAEFIRLEASNVGGGDKTVCIPRQILSTLFAFSRGYARTMSSRLF